MRKLYILFLFASLSCFAVEGNFPAWYETTTHLNVRVSDNARAHKITTLPPNAQIRVDYITSNTWAAIEYGQQRVYVSARYIRYVRDVEAEAATTKPSGKSTSHKKGIWSWLFIIGPWIIGFPKFCPNPAILKTNPIEIKDEAFARISFFRAKSSLSENKFFSSKALFEREFCRPAPVARPPTKSS